mgnify:CR=1 FL=1
MNLELEQSFIKRVDALDKGDRVALKRNAGLVLTKASGAACSAFYKCSPSCTAWNEDRWFFGACVRALWKPEQSMNISFIDALRAIKEKEGYGGMDQRLTIILDGTWDEDGFFCRKLDRMMMLMKQKEKVIDIPLFIHDMNNWDDEDKRVQKNWAQAYYRIDSKKKEKKNVD